MRFYVAAVFSLLIALPAQAQWYARGQFNSWPESGDNVSGAMTDGGGGHYTAVVSDTAGECVLGACEFKAAKVDWADATPGGANNAKAYLNGGGELTIHLYDNTNWNDGWSPNNQRRIGYDDSGLHGWDLMGTFFDNFGIPTPMTNPSSGVYHAELVLDAGFYDFKFRKTDDWGLNYGNNFANGSNNNTIRVLTNDQTWKFDLDLPGGRWRAYTDDPQPDRTGDEHATAADYVVARMVDGAGQAVDAWRGGFGYSPWFMRGTFNDYGGISPTYLMTDEGNGHYTGTVTTTPNSSQEYKLANQTFTNAWPALNNGKTYADGTGQITFHLWEQPDGGWTDGWFPKNDLLNPVVNRVGYKDHNQFEWELLGDVQATQWTSDPAWYLDDLGNGLHSTDPFVITAADEYEFKFRKIGDNDFIDEIGDSFAGNPNNAKVDLTPGTWRIELDLPGGRWRPVLVSSTIAAGSAVPEPASLMLVLLGAMLGIGVTRRRS